MKTSIRSLNLLGVKFHNILIEELRSYIEAVISENRKEVIGNVNILALNIAYHDKKFRDFLNVTSKLVFCDGAGVILAARLVGVVMHERITYADWIWVLAKYICDNNYRVFF